MPASPRNTATNPLVLALSVARMGDAIGNSIMIIVIPLYVAKLPSPWFSLPISFQVGLLISLYGLVNALLQPIMGALSDRTGRRKLLIQLGLLCMGLGTLAFMLASRYSDLLILRAVQGLGVALTIPASLALMASVTEQKTRGRSMGLYTTMRMVGFSIGPLLGGYLHDQFGFYSAFQAGAGFIFVGLFVVQFLVREEPSRSYPSSPSTFHIIDTQLLSTGLVGTAMATFLMASAFSMITPLENEINARLGQSATDFGIAFSAMVVSRLIFQTPLGRLSDLIGRKPLIIAGLILMAPTTILLGWVTSTGQLIGTRVGQGIASAAIAAPAFALAADLSTPGGEGRQMSIITMGFGLGISLGPLLAGSLAVSSLQLPFLIGGLLSLLGALLVLWVVPETVRGDKSRA